MTLTSYRTKKSAWLSLSMVQLQLFATEGSRPTINRDMACNFSVTAMLLVPCTLTTD